jgi:hypothetical protein
MRKLVHIPIVHTPEDLGSHLPEVKREYIARHGLSNWRHHIKALDRFWQELSETLLHLPVDYTKLKLYQDGLPVFGRELEMVKELAENGNRNYRLLFELAKRGAVVVGSEDPQLLIEERDRLIKKGVANPDLANPYDELMERRDNYIAQRIASTLKDGEIGLLFMGALHRVVDKLPKDIHVQRSLSDLKIAITNDTNE